MQLALFTTLLCLAIGLSSGKRFGKCELASHLVSLGVPRSEVHHWVCMADRESNRWTDARNDGNSNGSSDYGIFQINSYFNCDPRDGRTTKNGCRKACSSFMNDDISDDVACIQQLLREHRNRGGFSSFSAAYGKYCVGTTSSYLSDCSY